MINNETSTDQYSALFGSEKDIAEDPVALRTLVDSCLGRIIYIFDAPIDIDVVYLPFHMAGINADLVTMSFLGWKSIPGSVSTWDDVEGKLRKAVAA